MKIKDGIVNVTILGSTGSIGTQTLNVIRNLNSQKKMTGKEYNVVGIAAKGKDDFGKLLDQVNEFHPDKVALFDEDAPEAFRAICPEVDVVAGDDGLEELAKDDKADIIINALLGAIGLKSTICALETGHRVGFANKETLVAGGEFVMKVAKENEYQSELLPIDSEHSALFQSMMGQPKNRIKRVIITASGGTFRDKTYDEIKQMNPSLNDVLKHPNWTMGAKITVDSATMMNKALEVIEAHWLYALPLNKIATVLHRQSILHSAVEYIDGSIIGQFGEATMEKPIQFALTYPDRIFHPTKFSLIPEENDREYVLTFQKLDRYDPKYKCFDLGLSAIEKGGYMPAVMNAANEIAVNAFINGRIAYLDIPKIIEQAMIDFEKTHITKYDGHIEKVFLFDRLTRVQTESIIKMFYER
ncbi:1-deoxy-D-xylulose-5-phosphate reductoisomerase [Candidatus Micrarchaeota archaeon]|nr:1-deoxy-D-xylulose-5-phosphate reductoisomerase [Candidatus Micrarchaeota archaeon]